MTKPLAAAAVAALALLAVSSASAAPTRSAPAKPTCAVPAKYRNVIDTYYGKSSVYAVSCTVCASASVAEVASNFDSKATPLAAARAQAVGSYFSPSARAASTAGCLQGFKIRRARGLK